MKKSLVFLLIILIAKNAFAYIAADRTSNECDDNTMLIDKNQSNLHAIFTPKKYTCNSGYFVPASIEGCHACGIEHECPGGTYTFKTDSSSGIKWTLPFSQSSVNSCVSDFIKIENNHAKLHAIFSPHIHVCDMGEYLPAGIDECHPCAENHYCPDSGTYTFNEKIDQGIIECPSTHPYAPIGMWAESQCGRKLYIGGEYLYLHQSPAVPAEHRLYARIETRVYSANATPIIDNPDLKMSANTQRALHVKIDGVEYLIHDDSVR